MASCWVALITRKEHSDLADYFCLPIGTKITVKPSLLVPVCRANSTKRLIFLTPGAYREATSPLAEVMVGQGLKLGLRCI